MEIITRITGNTIEKYANNTLFSPLGMINTHYDERCINIDNFVPPITYRNNIETIHSQYREMPSTGDSGVFSNAVDLSKFAQCILNNGKVHNKKIVDNKVIDNLINCCGNKNFGRTSGYFINSNKGQYGCFSKVNSKNAICHPGFTGCEMLIEPYKNYAITIVSNSLDLGRQWSLGKGNELQKLNDYLIRLID